MHRKIMRDEALSLEGDGIIPKIYSLLTNKDHMFGTMPTIFLPHTVIFAYDIPEAWYFGNEKGVLRKLKINITLENIEKAFLKDVPKCGIAAQFIEVGSEENASPTVFTYILKEDLKSFLQSKKPNGILQKFVAPKGVNNYVLRVTWSPNFSLFEKVENNMKLDADGIDVYQKAITLEGRDYQVRTIPLRGSVLPQKLDKLAHAIFHHIRKSTHENIMIARMTLIFKIDEEGKLWFLYCTSLRVQPEENEKLRDSISLTNHVKPQDLNVVLLSPSNINVSKGAVVKMKSLKKSYKCQNCGKQLDSKQFFNISLRQVIHEFEKDRQMHYPEGIKPKKQVKKSYGFLNKAQAKPEEMDVIDATIPKLILNLYPELRHEEYEILKREPGFLYLETQVCEDCYLDFSNDPEYVQNSKALAKEFENFHPRGTGGLRPEKLEQRRTKTQLHGKEFNDQLNSLLIPCKQKKCLPGAEYSDLSPSERIPRTQEISFNGSIRITMDRRKSQPKITEEDLFDRSDDGGYESATVRAEPRTESIFKKIINNQSTMKGSQSNRSPNNCQSGYFQSFYKKKPNLFTDKLYDINLPTVAPKTTKNRTSSQNREPSLEKSQSANSSMIHFMSTLKNISKVEDSDWKNLQSRSRQRIIKVYGRTSSLKSFKNIKAESMTKDSR